MMRLTEILVPHCQRPKHAVDENGALTDIFLPAIPFEGYGWLGFKNRLRDALAVLRGEAIAVENWESNQC